MTRPRPDHEHFTSWAEFSASYRPSRYTARLDTYDLLDTDLEQVDRLLTQAHRRLDQIDAFNEWPRIRGVA